jgi:nitrogen fixation NifU-like protein
MTVRDPKTLYQEVILDHGRAPRNEGALADATHEATAHNPLCGDRVTLRVRVDGGAVCAARFEARGCMIARASASLLTEAIVGRSVSEALELVRTVERVVAGEPTPHADTGGVERGLERGLEPLRGGRQFPARRACITLAWHALEAALGQAGAADGVVSPPT